MAERRSKGGGCVALLLAMMVGVPGSCAYREIQRTMAPSPRRVASPGPAPAPPGPEVVRVDVGDPDAFARPSFAPPPLPEPEPVTDLGEYASPSGTRSYSPRRSRRAEDGVARTQYVRGYTTRSGKHVSGYSRRPRRR